MLDPHTVRLTRHVVDRYMERRGWPTSDEISRLDAEATIRNLLSRVAHKNPPMFKKPGELAVRRYVHGELAWVVDANNTTVITFYPHTPVEHRRRPHQKGRSSYVR